MGKSLIVVVGTVVLFFLCIWLAEITNPPAAAAATPAPAAAPAAAAPAPSASAAAH